jgi:hypothetical protein
MEDGESTNDQKPTPEATPKSLRAIIEGTANQTYERQHRRSPSLDGPLSQPQQTSDNTPRT